MTAACLLVRNEVARSFRDLAETLLDAADLPPLEPRAPFAKPTVLEPMRVGEEL